MGQKCVLLISEVGKGSIWGGKGLCNFLEVSLVQGLIIEGFHCIYYMHNTERERESLHQSPWS